MYKIGVAGATGYTGVELLRILSRHPDVDIVRLTSETYQGQRIDEVFPSLRGFVDITLEPLSADTARGLDILFLALPHTAAMDKAPGFLSGNCRLVDLSADFRLKDPAVFETWYKTPHVHPELLKEAVYGLPELYRESIKTAKLLANPGCYPTSVILGLAPLLGKGWIDESAIISDSKSGASGAGRKASQTTQFAEVNEGISAYAAPNHRHTPEIEQEISALVGREIGVTFTPHLMPMTRGILSTIYAPLKRKTTQAEAQAHYAKFYQDEPFVRVLPPGAYAGTRFVSGSNFCDVGLHVDERNQRLIITSAIDNLIKGASGQAVQNMNIMLGLNEKAGIDFAPIYP
ncbi:MAG: N-acetyl-gamma-glutamyl-phosphate reductase [Candidatus Nitrohelix vancouverensis]|uniref:N-acetyl-gamma-glutamyl-phosphate reductase n=1 Tax=Candidatus Nitrohelix vancouverensis TaxID=2705534 RepID=A0A7T0BZR8_9BACT|nr:MAG: N-acetyl-gamma-glutamyl-phosphate reductase [Candidatus Nitrohelix vancouverensis]